MHKSGPSDCSDELGSPRPYDPKAPSGLGGGQVRTTAHRRDGWGVIRYSYDPKPCPSNRRRWTRPTCLPPPGSLLGASWHSIRGGSPRRRWQRPHRWCRSHTFSVLSSEAETASGHRRHRHAPDPAGMPFEGAEQPGPWRGPTPSASYPRRRRRRSGHPPSPPRRCTPAVCPSRVRSAWPVSRSHTFSVLSRGGGDGEAAIRRHRHASHTTSVCPSRVRSAWPVSRSHTFSVLSSEAETAKRPSDVTATAMTQPVCPSRVRSACPVSRSHTFSVLSPEAETASGHPTSPPRP